MDIQQWLDRTVLPEQPPSLPCQRSDGPSSCHGERGWPPKEKRRRKPSTSDSSLLNAPRQRMRAPPITREAGVDESADDGASPDASRLTSPSGSSTSSQHYARRPRRKTRPERYEPALKDAKGRGTHASRARNRESNRTKRKPRRKRVEAPASGVVLGFDAKNVSGDRLTLRPRGKLGLFNKGRASSPVKGRGLPDLVFSEMKFLQKNKDQPEVDHAQGVTKKKRKTDHAHAKEAEISAYFTSVRPALAERDVNTQAKEASHRKKLRDIDCRERVPSPAVDRAIQTVKSADKVSYLGFGSRGPRHGSDSYISWSESIRAPSAMPGSPRMGFHANDGQLNSVHDSGHHRGNTDGGGLLHPRLNPPTETGHITTGNGDRFQVSLLAPANDCFSHSHSLPHRTSSPRRVNLVDRATKCRRLESSASLSSMPPFVPGHSGPQSQIHPPTPIADANPRKDTRLANQGDDTACTGDKHASHEAGRDSLDAVEPRTSSSLGRILQECNAVIRESQRTARSYGRDNMGAEASKGFCPQALEARPGHCPTIRSIPTVRFSGVDEVYCPPISNFSRPSIYQQQEERHYLDQQFDRTGDVLSDVLLEGEYSGGEETDFRERECEVGTWPASIRAEHGESLEDMVGARVDDDEYDTGLDGGLVANAGFWRPHKLY